MGDIYKRDTITVDRDFVRFGPRAFAISEIKTVTVGSHRTDGHVIPVLTFSAFLVFILWIPAPSQNSFMLLFLSALLLAIWHKYENPKPVVHTLHVSTGGILNSYLHQTEDEDEVRSLHEAVEAAIRMRTDDRQLPSTAAA